MIKNSVVNLLDTIRMCFLSESEKGDLVVICKDGHVTISRVLFSFCCSLLKAQLEEDFMNQENSCITLEVEKAKFELLFQKLLFASGEIDKSFVNEFPFIDWKKFSVSDSSTKIPSTESRPFLKESFSKNTPLMPKIQSHAEGVAKIAENVKKCDVENSKPRVECNICGKSLSDKKNLKKHCDVVHFNIRKFNCEICTKRFITRKDLMIHIQSIHNQQKFICDQCGQALSTRQGLRQHSLIHKEGSKSIPCSRCALKFRHVSTLRKHIQRIHEKPAKIACNFCDKLFNHDEGLKRHKRKYHISTPTFQCDKCQKSFVFNYDLNKHKKRAH